MDKTQYLKNLWLWKCGKDEINIHSDILKYEDLKISEWDAEVEKLCKNRLIMGAYRYGLLKDTNKKKYDRLGSIRKRLDKYIETGNTENLIDIQNLAMLEFVEGKHPKKHFHAVDEGDHTDEIVLEICSQCYQRIKKKKNSFVIGGYEKEKFCSHRCIEKFLEKNSYDK